MGRISYEATVRQAWLAEQHGEWAKAARRWLAAAKRANKAARKWSCVRRAADCQDNADAEEEQQPAATTIKITASHRANYPTMIRRAANH